MPLGHDLAAMAQLINERTRLVFVANPNNPTGTWVDADALRRFVAAVPEQTLVVVDEAYIEYVSAPGFPDASRWLAEFPNLRRDAHVLEGLWPGGPARRLRAVASVSGRHAQSRAPAVQRQFDRARCGAGERSMTASTCNVRWRRNRAGMAQLRAGFDALGVRHLPSAGNFVMIDCGRPGGCRSTNRCCAGA